MIFDYHKCSNNVPFRKPANRHLPKVKTVAQTRTTVFIG